MCADKTSSSNRPFKFIVNGVYWIVSIAFGIFIAIFAFLIFTFYESSDALAIQSAVSKAIEGGRDELAASDVFSPENGFSANGYDTLCFLRGASAPADYSVYVEKLLSSDQINGTQFRNLPDMFEHFNHAALFILFKGDAPTVIHLRKIGFIAKGKNRKSDFFSFRFDKMSRTDASDYYGCHPFSDAVFKFYFDSKRPYTVFLSKQH